jgi:hypothetical protein
MQAFVQEMRERFYGLAPDALATIEYALREQKDARIGLEVLRDIGVRPQKGESVQLPATTPTESGYEDSSGSSQLFCSKRTSRWECRWGRKSKRR